jgi:hypothetical protein
MRPGVGASRNPIGWRDIEPNGETIEGGMAAAAVADLA